ncbi:hypothetical protein [Phyllobacterium sp. CL33Tsu]|uniref:hypothetical protein n=1 Tax=Phyllobacterium sp. CL33Tsu TaxID=1798191 RepID=UPI001113D121|nr:hypothetical protein [Phyllobacterium sp. CL33Tsu]
MEKEPNNTTNQKEKESAQAPKAANPEETIHTPRQTCHHPNRRKNRHPHVQNFNATARHDASTDGLPRNNTNKNTLRKRNRKLEKQSAKAAKVDNPTRTTNPPQQSKRNQTYPARRRNPTAPGHRPKRAPRRQTTAEQKERGPKAQRTGPREG